MNYILQRLNLKSYIKKLITVKGKAKDENIYKKNGLQS